MNDEKRIAAIEERVQKQHITISLIVLTLIIIVMFDILVGIKFSQILGLLEKTIQMFESLSDLVRQ